MSETMRSPGGSKMPLHRALVLSIAGLAALISGCKGEPYGPNTNDGGMDNGTPAADATGGTDTTGGTNKGDKKDAGGAKPDQGIDCGSFTGYVRWLIKNCPAGQYNVHTRRKGNATCNVGRLPVAVSNTDAGSQAQATVMQTVVIDNSGTNVVTGSLRDLQGKNHAITETSNPSPTDPTKTGLKPGTVQDTVLDCNPN